MGRGVTQLEVFALLGSLDPRKQSRIRVRESIFVGRDVKEGDGGRQKKPRSKHESDRGPKDSLQVILCDLPSVVLDLVLGAAVSPLTVAAHKNPRAEVEKNVDDENLRVQVQQSRGQRWI